MSIAIRELGLADSLLLGELLDTLTPDWTDHLAPGASGPTAFLAQSRSFAIGAYADSDPAGWVWGTAAHRPDGTLDCRLGDLAVLPEQRRRGIGTALLDAAIAHAGRQGCHHLLLVTEPDDPAGHALCNRAGGTRTANAPETYRWSLR
ncbi:MAG: GNAT family N-acetyltransferase [Actinomycetota bacterium]